MTKLAVVAVLFGGACELRDDDNDTLRASPGEPQFFAPDRWIQGTPVWLSFEWRNASICNFDDWFCRIPPNMTTTVLGVDCHGCTVLVDPTGLTRNAGGNSQQFPFEAVATTDGLITVEVHLRFDATGAERTLVAHGTGEHEVGLDLQCALVDESALSSAAGGPIAMPPLRACGSTRGARDVVLALIRVKTSTGALYVPFCPTTFSSCSLTDEHPYRSRDLLSASPTPVAWGTYVQGDFPVFAQFAREVAGTVTVRTRLATGVDVEASLTVPVPPSP